MLISFREAADLSLQIAIAVTTVICGTSLATVTAKSEPKPRQAIDLSRPALWEATLVRIDRQWQPLAILVHKPTTTVGQVENMPCFDAIGLRIACDLVKANHRPS